MTEAQQHNGGDSGDSTLLPQPRGGARTWYEVLEVAEDAGAADIQKAYERALALVEGRSIGGYLMLDPLAAESARADVEAAYAILGDGERRAQYDRARGATPAQPPADKPAEVKPAQDEEAREARAILGVGPAVEEPARPQPAPESATPSTLPRASTPVKFASPITAEVKAVDVPEEQRPASTGPAKKAPIKFESAFAEPDATEPGPALAPVHTVPPQAPMPAPTPPSAPPVAAAPAGPPALPEGAISGAFIKELRTRAGLTIESLADATKIRKPYLKAIEEEDIAGLPARVYLRGFLTQVARVLKVDRARLAEGYLQFVESKGGFPKE